MSRYDSDVLRRVSPHLRTGRGVPRARPFPVGDHIHVRARRRVARGLAALRVLPRGFAGATWDPARAGTELAEVGRWLEDFHPYSLVELDYGGLVQLLSDDALNRDQSVAEIAAAIGGVAKGERELAVAMYERAHSRWRAFAEYEMAN